MCRNNDFPTLADIGEILDPVPSKAEYIQAMEWEKRNGYDEFSDARRTINNYSLAQDRVKDNTSYAAISTTEDDRKRLWYEDK